MAVTLSIDTFSVVHKAVGAEMVDKLKALNIKASVVTSGLKLSQGGIVLAGVKGTPEQFKQLASGQTLMPHGLAGEILTAASVALDTASPASAMGALPHKPPLKKASPPVSFVPTPPAPGVAVSTGVYPEAEMNTGQPVKLRDAVLLYQPVLATDAASRYFMVARGSGLAIAARYRNNRLSLRVEGADFSSWTEQLLAFGFANVNTPNGYASMHFDGVDSGVAAKALGAVIVGLGLAVETPPVQFATIANKGV